MARGTALHPSSVVVVEPIGESSYPRATADEFEAGTLTVTSLDTGCDLRVYQPGQWRSYIVYAPDGYPEFGASAPVAVFDDVRRG